MENQLIMSKGAIILFIFLIPFMIPKKQRIDNSAFLKCVAEGNPVSGGLCINNITKEQIKTLVIEDVGVKNIKS